MSKEPDTADYGLIMLSIAAALASGLGFFAWSSTSNDQTTRNIILSSSVVSAITALLFIILFLFIVLKYENDAVTGSLFISALALALTYIIMYIIAVVRLRDYPDKTAMISLISALSVSIIAAIVYIILFIKF